MPRSVKSTHRNSTSENHFLSELFDKSSPLPFKSENGNECICINLYGCSKDFLSMLEGFLKDNRDQFRLVARGIDYYLEILDQESFLAACQKSHLRH